MACVRIIVTKPQTITCDIAIKMSCNFIYDTYKSKETQTFYIDIVPTVAIRCLSLPVPTNGVKTGCSDMTSEPYDKHCSFSCNVGYNLTGSPVRRCLENGSWSGQTSYCQSMINKKYICIIYTCTIKQGDIRREAFIP